MSTFTSPPRTRVMAYETVAADFRPPKLAPLTIHVWSMPICNQVNVADLASVLSDAERARASRYRDDSARRIFVSSRFFLRCLLSHYADRTPEEVQLSYGAAGKPQLAHRSARLQFNLSHTSRVVMCALTMDAEIGVDVEQFGSESARMEISSTVLSPSESASIDSLPAPLRECAFWQVWTCKEACIKASGEGLSLPLKSLEVRLHAEEQPQVLDVEGAKKWMVYALQTEYRHAAALAVCSLQAASPWQLRYWRFAGFPTHLQSTSRIS